MRNRRGVTLMLLAALAVLVAIPMTGFSTAVFTSRSTNTATVRAAADWTPPTVTMVSPGPSVRDTVSLSATASDGETGIQDVVIQYLPVGGTSWTTVCTTSSSPYTCSWATKGLADGSYDLRARATDRAGYSTTSAPVRTTVSNNVLLVLAEPADIVRGTVPLSATLHSGGTLTWSVRFEYVVTGGTTWRTICTAPSGTTACSWNTTTNAFTSGTEYDVRAVATSGSTTVVSNVATAVLVDNVAPTVTMTDPGTPLSGTRTFAATASDAHSGVAEVTIQYLPAGGSTWQALCTTTAAPFSCRYATTNLPDGTYSFRAVATDFAGNTATSAPVANRVVDNTVSSVSLQDPGAFLAGTVTLTSTPSSTAGIASVAIQYAPAGTTAWTTICTATASPWSCAWDTTKVADGSYDLRAVLVDGRGGQTISATEAARRVDNTPLRGFDVQATGGGAVAGRIDQGDSISFTWTEQVAPSSILPGWNGGATPVTLRVRDGNLVGTGNRGDTLDVLVGGGAVNLGSVNLRDDFVRPNKTVTFAATMTAGTVTIDGQVRSVVTIQLGTASGAGSLRTVSNAQAMVWSPSGAVTDLNGRVGSTAPTTETGALDRDF